MKIICPSRIKSFGGINSFKRFGLVDLRRTRALVKNSWIWGELEL